MLLGRFVGKFLQKLTINNMKNTVIYHKADYDGIFSREVAKKFLPADTTFIGWDYGDESIEFPSESGNIYILDLPPEEPFGRELSPYEKDKIIWIDHHRSNIIKYD
jgi:oligoribonuclease NrnB/cAMP/cGMP phosphodiesterase (DHH superfamily)